MNRIIILIFLGIFPLFLFSQTRESLSISEKKFLKDDLSQYKLQKTVVDPKYDSVISIHYKGGLYVLAKYGDSLKVIQNIAVDKIDDPKNRKIIFHQIRSCIVYEGLMDTFIISKPIFTSLYNLASNKELNNPNIKVTNSDPKTSDDNFYFESHDHSGNADTFKLNNFIWLKKNSLQIMGWQLRRLVLQLYLNYGHWNKLTQMVRKAGKGYFALNNIILDDMIYFFDGKNSFIESYSKEIWDRYIPIQFVSPLAPKPDNPYPYEPARPFGVKGRFYEDR